MPRPAPEAGSWGLRPGEAVTTELTAQRTLGGGSSYEALLAFDEVTYAPVVVKLVQPGLVEDAATLRALRREVEALAVVNHPVGVRGLRSQVDGPRPHLVLEHVEGPRLSTLIRRYGPLQPQQYLPLAIDLASALHYLRGIGWTHLDIKPSNVIMGAPARLIDLSVARPVDEAARLTSVIGTDRYLAPEQAEPGGRYGVPGPASDVWGLAAALFEAVAGLRPFDGGDLDSPDPAVSHPQLVELPYELPSGTADEVVKALLAGLEKRPEDRPLPHELAETLGPVLERLPRPKLGGWKS